jgi:uncharacterized protein (DUF1697 family)
MAPPARPSGGPPARCVALLRGINVGRAKRVPMAVLRDAVASLGYGEVATLLNSGNVVYASPRDAVARQAARIRAAVADACGVDAAVVALAAPDFLAAVDGAPWRPDDPEAPRLLLAFPRDPAALAALAALASRVHLATRDPGAASRSADQSPDRLTVGRQVGYLACPDGVLASRLVAAVNRDLGEAVTMRNWATVMRVAALLRGSPGPGGGAVARRPGSRG